MKNLIIPIQLILLCHIGFGQTQKKFPVDKKLINIKGDTVMVKELLKDNQPKLFFFWFTGCAGCKISLDQTLINYYKQWKSEYGVQIIAISGDKEANRNKATEFFKKYPFDLYFDINKEFFVLMPETPWKERTIKAYPTLIYINRNLNFKALDPWDKSKIEDALNNYSNRQ